MLLQPGERVLDAERLVALPRAVGPGLHGLASDRRGFVLTDRYGKVPGAERVWAAGDAIAFPVKQGGLASQQPTPPPSRSPHWPAPRSSRGRTGRCFAG